MNRKRPFARSLSLRRWRRGRLSRCRYIFHKNQPRRRRRNGRSNSRRMNRTRRSSDNERRATGNRSQQREIFTKDHRSRNSNANVREINERDGLNLLLGQRGALSRANQATRGSERESERRTILFLREKHRGTRTMRKRRERAEERKSPASRDPPMAEQRSKT
ncbi:hypothetical protein YC2023_109733 [Brassica napus]